MSPSQQQAMDLLRAAPADPDGYTGLAWTSRVYRIEDSTAWIYYRTAVALERQGLVEIDLYGRIRVTV